jgi:predicted kinase
MMFVVFDFDGTLALIEHRRHHIAGPSKNYDAFFDACGADLPNPPVIHALKTYLGAPERHRVEIWSGRSDRTRAASEAWLAQQGVPPAILTRMRRDGDYTKDYVLKECWLKESAQRPDVIFDDRQSVVDMWRRNGVTCFQVAPGDFDAPQTVAPHARHLAGEPLLHILVGPSGAGKTTYAHATFDPGIVLCSDQFRAMLCGDTGSQERNADVFRAMALVTQARLSAGVPTVIDATNVRRKDRLAFVDLATPAQRVRYHIIDRTLAEILATRAARRPEVVERHFNAMRSQMKDILAGDNRTNVDVLIVARPS